MENRRRIVAILVAVVATILGTTLPSRAEAKACPGISFRYEFVGAPQMPALTELQVENVLCPALAAFKSKFPAFFHKVEQQRYTFNVHRNTDPTTFSGDITLNYMAFVDPDDRVVHLSRELVTEEDESRLFGFAVKTQMILHELFHVADGTVLPESVFESFAERAGFKKLEINNFMNRTVEKKRTSILYMQYEMSRVPMNLVLILDADSGPGRKLRRRQALLPYGFPSYYSLAYGPIESLCEFFSHVIVDPAARGYMGESLYDWIYQIFSA